MRYPKKGEPHTLDMLVAVCARCHEISHGAKEVEPLTNPKNTVLTGPHNNNVTVFHANGLVWATIEQWADVLQAPRFLPEFLRTNAEMQASLLRGGQYSASCGGTKVYRWPPIAAALDVWHRQWMVKVSKNEHVLLSPRIRSESEGFARNVFNLKAWGYELQEKELQAAMNVRMTQEQTNTGIADTKQAMQAIQSLAQATQVVLEDHEERLDAQNKEITQIKSSIPLYRPADEFITIKQRCLERSLPFGIVVQGRMNLTQACGQYLKNNGAQQGTPLNERLDGQTLTAPVSTWKRGEIDAAIDYYMPGNDDPAQLSLLEQ